MAAAESPTKRGMGTPKSSAGSLNGGDGPVLTRQGSRTVVSNPLITAGAVVPPPCGEDAKATMLLDGNAHNEVAALRRRAVGLANDLYTGTTSRSMMDYSVLWPEYVVPEGQALIERDAFPVFVYLSSLSQAHHDEDYHVDTRVGWLRCKRDDGPLRRHKVELHGSMLLVHPSPDAPPAGEEDAPADAAAAAAAGANAAGAPPGGDADPSENGEGAGGAGGAGAGTGADEGADDGESSESDTDEDGVVQISLNSVTTFRPSALDLGDDPAIAEAKAAGATNTVWAVDAVTPRGTWVLVLGLPGPEQEEAKAEQIAAAKAKAQADADGDTLPEIASKQKMKRLKKQRRASQRARGSSAAEDVIPEDVATTPQAALTLTMAEQFAQWVRGLAKQVPKSSLSNTIRRLVTEPTDLAGVEDVKKVTIRCTAQQTVQELVSAVLDKLAHLNRQQRRHHGNFMLKATGKRDYAVTKSRRILELEYVQDCLRDNQEVEFSLVRNVAQPLRRLSVRATMVQTRQSAADLADKLAALTGLKAGPEVSEDHGDSDSSSDDEADADEQQDASAPTDGAADDQAPVDTPKPTPGGDETSTVTAATNDTAVATPSAGDSAAQSVGGDDATGNAKPSSSPTPSDGSAASSGGRSGSDKPMTRIQRLAQLRKRRASLAVSPTPGSDGASPKSALTVDTSSPAGKTTKGDSSGSPAGDNDGANQDRNRVVPIDDEDDAIPDNALHMDHVRWPFRVGIRSVDNVKAIAHRMEIVHGEEKVSTVPLPLTALSVQVQLYFGGSLLPGCDMETRTVPFGSSARWLPEAKLQTDLNLRDIPPDSRVVFVLRGVWPEAVEPERIACVAVPLTDYRRMLVMGEMSLRLWPNIVDVEHTPPAEDTVHASPPVLHVQFDTFMHPIVSPLYLEESVGGRVEEAEPPIEKLGWMHKLGKAGRLTKWKRRWFVLAERTCTLTYFASNLDDKPKGVIDLFDFSVEEADELNQNYQKIVGSTRKTLNTYCFKLVKKGARTFYIYTESKHDRREWMDNIARVISSDVAMEKSKAAAQEKGKTKSGFGSFFRRRKSSTTLTDAPDAPAASSADTAASKLDSGQVDASSWVSAIADLIADDAPLPMFSARQASLVTDMAEETLDVSAAAEDAEVVAAAKATSDGDGGSGADGAEAQGDAAGDGDGDGATTDAEAGAGEQEGAQAGSGMPERWGPCSLFARCTNDPGLVYGFALVLAKAHSEENIMFWLEAEMYAQQCQPTFPHRLLHQPRLDAATRIFREYISKDADIGDMQSVTPAHQRRQSVSALGADDLTVGLSGPCTAAIVAQLQAAHRGEASDDGGPVLAADLFAEAQVEIGRRIHEAFRSMLSKKALEDALGFSPQVESIVGLFDRSMMPERNAMALAAWYRTLCTLHGGKGDAALKSTMAQNPHLDPEYAAQCVVELNYSSAAGNFIGTQAGTGRTPRNVYKPKVLNADLRAKIYASLWPANLKVLPASMQRLLRKAGRLQGFLEKRWFCLLDDVAIEQGGLKAFVPPAVSVSTPKAPTPGLSIRRPSSMRSRASISGGSPASRRPTYSPRMSTRMASLRRVSCSPTTLSPASGDESKTDKQQPTPAQRRASRIARVTSMRGGALATSPTKVVNQDEEGDAKAKAALNKCFAEDPLYEPDAMVRALVWRHRRDITHRPEAMPKFLKSVTWCRNQQVREAHRLVAKWAKLKRPVEAIELLDERFGDAYVRRFAVEQLRNLNDNELLFVLPQLVQALKYEVHHLSNLALFLLERGLRNPTQIGLQLFWAFKVEIGCRPEVRLRYQLLLDGLVQNSTPRHQAILETQAQLWSQGGVFAQICEVVKSSKKLGKAKQKAVYREKLKEVNEMLPETFVLPIDPRIEARRVIPEECKFMSSAKLPLWLVFENADPDGDKIMVMFKAGDDLRQDTVTLQLIRVMDSLWRQGGMDLRLSPYRCISTWHDGGMLEIVRNAATTAEIQKKYGGKFGAYKDSTFDDWIRDNNPKQAAYQRAVDVFTVSAAGYVVATYLMGIGDRHNDNIMVKKSGHYFHIDFGHFLGNFKYAGFIKRERSRFVFTPEMAYVMGGSKAAKFREFERLCIKALNHLRRHGTNLINLFTLVVPAGMPELSSKEDINYLRDMLALNLTDDEVADRFRQDMQEALSNKFKRFDNTMHILKHG